jgi:hypothetical protein
LPQSKEQHWARRRRVVLGLLLPVIALVALLLGYFLLRL